MIGGFGLTSSFEPFKVVAELTTDLVDFFEPLDRRGEQQVDVILFVLEPLGDVGKFFAFGGACVEKCTHPGELTTLFVELLASRASSSFDVVGFAEALFEAFDPVAELCEHAVTLIELGCLSFDVGTQRGDLADEFVSSRTRSDRIGSSQ